MQPFFIMKVLGKGALGCRNVLNVFPLFLMGKIALCQTNLSYDQPLGIQFVSQWPTVDGNSVVRPHLKSKITYTAPVNINIAPAPNIT
jgi:hypothetical protein